MEKRKSSGITVVAGIYAIFYIIAGFLWWQFLKSDIHTLSYPVFITKFFIQRCLVDFFLILSIILAMCNVGTMFYKKWIREIYLILVWGFIILFLYTVLLHIAEHFICTDDCRPTISGNKLLVIVMLFFAMCISSIIYFTRPKIKEQFK